jgi:hypothetical protein
MHCKTKSKKNNKLDFLCLLIGFVIFYLLFTIVKKAKTNLVQSTKSCFSRKEEKKEKAYEKEIEAIIISIELYHMQIYSMFRSLLNIYRGGGSCV